MALTRAFLKDVLADHSNRDELIDQIIDAHMESVSGLKTEVEQAKKEAEETHSVTARIETLKSEIAALQPNGTSWEKEYKALAAEYEAAKAADARKTSYQDNAEAFCHLLVSHGMAYPMAKAISISSLNIISGIEMQNGKVRNYDAISAAIRSEYRDLLC